MSKPLQFIDLIETAGHQRTSALSIEGRQTKGGLCVVGNLPHNYEFKPKTANDRDRLVRWLQELTY